MERGFLDWMHVNTELENGSVLLLQAACPAMEIFVEESLGNASYLLIDRQSHGKH